METYKYLLDLAIILLCTKALGLATRKVQMPQVVGALLAGVLLGPAMLGILTETSFIHNVAEIGVIVLMFCAGLETDIQELKASGKASFVIALIGVIVPLIGGYATAMFFNRPGVITSDASCSVFLQNIFIGVILTATSVSITVETLKELGANEIPCIHVFNKCDIAKANGREDVPVELPHIGKDCIYMAAGQHIGLEELVQLISERIYEDYVDCTMLIPYTEGALVSYFNENATVKATEYEAEGTKITMSCLLKDLKKYKEYVIL